MLIKILILVLSIIILKAIYNFYYFCFAKFYFKKYLEYLNNQNDWYITRNKQNIVALLKKANIQDTFLPTAELIGYGYIQTGNFSVFNNIPLWRKDVAQSVGSFLKEAQGVFLNRIKESFNPIYWIEFFIFLPKNILNYLGFKGEGLFGRFLQLIWWLFNFISIIIGIFFNKEFMEWLYTFIR